MDINTLWKYSKGENVKIGIIDDSVDTSHPDLKDAYISSYINNYTTKATYHGTHCIGIISASDNDIGSVGIAPKSKYYVATFANTVADFIKSIYYFLDKDVAVVNNSWGTLVELDALNNALEVLAKQGRNGKGTVLVFASGNKNYNLDIDKIDLSELPFVLGVGAINEYNQKTSYSNYGKNIDIYAYGGENAGLVTTDEQGSKGYLKTNYRFSFHGTSASAPIVSGVVTLMMGVDNDLSASKAIEIIKKTSDLSEDGYPVLNAKKALNEVYINKNKTTLHTNDFSATIGWNLLGVNKDILLDDIKKKFKNPKTVWTYSDNNWKKNPNYIPANKGFWIKIQ
jgi:subtilisin family serine protease